jgi:hypothetical protein
VKRVANPQLENVMKKMAKLFLLISVASIAVSLTGPGSDILYGGLKPIGAIAFVAFFISNMLAKEFEAYDKEEGTKSQPATPRPQPESKISPSRVPQHA